MAGLSKVLQRSPNVVERALEQLYRDGTADYKWRKGDLGSNPLIKVVFACDTDDWKA